MPYYQVTLGITVQAYKTVRVNARSRRHAHQQVRACIHEFADDDTQGYFESDWSTADTLRIVPAETREEPHS